MEAELEAEQDTGMSSDEWMKTQEAKFAPLLDGLPALSRMSQIDDVAMGIDDLFECGLKLLLDGLGVSTGSAGR
jgi:hypothetical protein